MPVHEMGYCMTSIFKLIYKYSKIKIKKISTFNFNIQMKFFIAQLNRIGTPQKVKQVFWLPIFGITLRYFESVICRSTILLTLSTKNLFDRQKM